MQSILSQRRGAQFRRCRDGELKINCTNIASIDFACSHMSGLPRISGREGTKALTKLGYALRRQHGSHVILRLENPFSQLVVPDHYELDRGTLRAIIRQVNISIEEFSKLFLIITIRDVPLVN
jgi:predicted RNA binding protein YcfA (HicA-like mRNA interferase family)